MGGAVNRRRTAERLVWAVEVLAVEPDDRLLEIGCGHGVAVSLVCEKLGGGTIVAIDRSPTMIEAARKRNAACEARGAAAFRAVSLDLADFGGARFDKVFAIHVGVFLRGRPDRELRVIKEHLAPGGRLYLVDEPLDPGKARETVERLASVLENHGYAVADVLVHDLSATRVGCVIAEAGSS